ncbi:peptidyl-prolyl cis-trans isomerase, partial [Klebsiella pneumoniae]|uniref:peptidyl-prolyl cis-trans isomerase n=1 Tax=Klebsiella pneumoniae TaxID=573 RepID=UPI0038547CD0
AELRAAYDRNRSRYAEPGEVAFRHLYFSQDRGADAARAAAEAALREAAAGKAPAGDVSMLPLSYADAQPDMLARDYGPEFARAVSEAPIG